MNKTAILLFFFSNKRSEGIDSRSSLFVNKNEPKIRIGGIANISSVFQVECENNSNFSTGRASLRDSESNQQNC